MQEQDQLNDHPSQLLGDLDAEKVAIYIYI